MEPIPDRRRIVTEIVQDLKPELEDYFNRLLRFLPMKVRQVHEGSTHGPMVAKTNAYRDMGLYYNYLIRKEIYNLMGEEAFDYRAAAVLEELVDSFNLPRDSANEAENDEKKETPVDAEEPLKPVSSGVGDESEDEDVKRKCSVDTEKKLPKPFSSDVDNESKDDDKENKRPVVPKKVQKLIESYQKYQSPKNATIEITEDIFYVVKLHKLFYGELDKSSFDSELLNIDNIKTVLKHVPSFDRSNILLCPDVSCEYFSGLANVILDDILLQINTSVRPFRVNDIKCRKHMYQLLLYALGVFVKEGKEIRKFKVYNPLLGFEYDYEISHLDFNEFLELVKKIKPL